MARVLSGIQPSGELHLGNYLGALRRWVARQGEDDCFFCIVDLHALTLEVSPADLRAQSFQLAASYLAAGLDPDRSTIFLQSHVPEHTGLCWLLECTASYGELRRMTQFKDKGQGQESVRASLFTYPVLMAADILVYEAERVPVGDDQRQHLELTRDLALRFNARYGETFVVPEADIPSVGARIMDLQQPTRKMSKSTSSPQGLVALSDPPEEIVRKFRRAVTDNDTEVRHDPEQKPGVSNLLEILGAATDRDPVELAAQYPTYGALKADVGEAVVELLRPVRQSLLELTEEPGTVHAALAKGAEKARAVAGPVLERAREAMGLLPPG